MTASAVHVAAVNEQRLLGHLKSMFSTSTKLLAELMQNARRAGASRVEFVFDPDTATLVVSDDGCGIETFRSILTVAESGWAEDVQADESPYGIGFFSVVFGAETVLVESNRCAIRFTADDLINKVGIPEQPTSFSGGTRVSLISMRLKPDAIQAAVKSFAQGFAIPVFWNGLELPRLDAADAVGGVETAVGRMTVCGLDPLQPHYVKDFAVYCQGLPIRVGDLPQAGSHRNILHLDHHRFFPRIPDRDSVIDGEAAAKEIRGVLRGLWREFLEEQKRNLPPETFAERYWTLTRELRMADIMNDVDVIPSSELSLIDQYPVITHWDNSNFGSCEHHVTRSQVESGAVVLFEEADGEEYGLNWLRLCLAEKMNLVFLGSRLPDGHWAAPHVRDLSEEPVKVHGTVVKKDSFSGRWASGRLRLVRDFKATMLGQTVDMTHAVCVGRDSDEATLLIPDLDGDFSRVLRQVSSYVNSNEEFQYTDKELDAEELSNLVAEMRGEPPEVTVKKLLAEARNKPTLLGCRFTVEITAQGEIAVLAA